jgi:hypothetical protein
MASLAPRNPAQGARKPGGRHLQACLLCALLWGMASAVWAQDASVHATEEPEEIRVREINGPIEKRIISESLRLAFYGYLDGSYVQNFNNPSNGINQLRIFDVEANQFRPNVAKLVLEREARTDGDVSDLFGFRVKFNAGKDSEYIGGTNLSPLADFQELYAQFIFPYGNGIDIKFGRMNTLVGYESVESPWNPNFSRSWMFGLGQPFTTVGLRASYKFNEQVSFSIGGINSITSATGDGTNDLMVEAALTVKPISRVEFTLYGLFGPRPGQTPNTGGNRVLGGGMLTYQITNQAQVILEAYYANQANSSALSPGKNARWDGVAGYLVYDFTEQWGIRIRGEIFEDAGGFVTCNGTETLPKANVCFGSSPTATSPDVAQTLWETTYTLQFRPWYSLMTRLEYRQDHSNKGVFQRGNAPSSQQETLAFEVVYLF